MTDTVNDGLNVDQVSKDLAVPGTPKVIVHKTTEKDLAKI
jgi:hypothetical protein